MKATIGQSIFDAHAFAAWLALSLVLHLNPVWFANAWSTEKSGGESSVQVQENDPDGLSVSNDPVIYQAACPFVLQGIAQGRLLPPIADGDCGEKSPYEIVSVSGLKLSSPAIMNCNMVAAVAAWAVQVNQASVQFLESRIAQLQVSTSYQCRRRNNSPTGKISEHGFANGLDLTGFVLESGGEITIEADWPFTTGDENGTQVTKVPVSSAGAARFLVEVHQAACVQVTTVLGPESDESHRDHFHFDLGCHGRDCTYRICE